MAVIEAGGFYELDNGNVSQIPAFYAKNFNQTPVADTIQPLIDWAYITEPQVVCNTKPCRNIADWHRVWQTVNSITPRAKHLAEGVKRNLFSKSKLTFVSTGRNSNIFTRYFVTLRFLNAAKTFRGTKGYYQRWADLVGDPSWAWESILPYFKKSIDFTPPNTAKMGVDANISYDPAAYGQGGPLHVTYSNYYQPMNPGLIKGFKALNFSSQSGFSSGRMDGYGYLAVSIDPDTQIKDSSETAFLTQAFNATDFRVYKNTLAKKITFDGTTATGVEVETAGLSYTLKAAKEVIVSAGVVSDLSLGMIYSLIWHGRRARLRCSWCPGLAPKRS